MLKYLKKSVLQTLKYLSVQLPKKHNLWIFGAWNGKIYADNTKYMFEHVQQFHPEITAIWLTKNRDLIGKINGKCYYYHSLRGIWATLRAEFAFETEGEGDISDLLSYKKTKIIQLWHGMGFKTMTWKNKDGEISHHTAANVERFVSYYWMAPSKFYVDVVGDLLFASKGKTCITGYPRNDTFISKPYNGYMENIKAKYNGYKFIIYMPTHRNFGKDGNKTINYEALVRLDKELQKRNIIMVYKPHIHELKNFLQYEDDFKNIIMAKEVFWADVYSYLHYFDLLISDYSSVITDFMCSGKPVLYFTYDIEDYNNTDGGLCDYFWTLSGGPFCKSWEELLVQLDAAFESDPFKDKREHCRKEYHFYNDGKNCERVFDAVIDLVSKSGTK